MEAILKFTLPEETEEHRLALDGSAWMSVVYELDELLRGHLKYGHPFTSIEETLTCTRQALHDFCEANNVTLH